VYIPEVGECVAGGAQRAKYKKKNKQTHKQKKHNYNGVEVKNITMTFEYIITLIYHRHPAKGLQISNKEYKQQNTNKE